VPHIHEKYDFTVSAYIVHPTEPKICLLKHMKLGKWMQPGGHVELDEDPIQALKHELLEETGLVLSKCKFLAQPEYPNVRKEIVLQAPLISKVHEYHDSHKHIDSAYLLQSYTAEFKPAEDESQEIRWFSLEQIQKLEVGKEVFPGSYDICLWIFKTHM